MGMLPARNYVSPHTAFIGELIDKNPRIVDEQRKGRALWWDKTPRDLAERRAMDRGRVPQKPYVYALGNVDE